MKVTVKKLFLSIVLLLSENTVTGQLKLSKEIISTEQSLQRTVSVGGVFRATATEFPLVPKPTGSMCIVIKLIWIPII